VRAVNNLADPLAGSERAQLRASGSRQLTRLDPAAGVVLRAVVHQQQRLGAVVPLADASGQRRHAGDIAAIFFLFQNDRVTHGGSPGGSLRFFFSRCSRRLGSILVHIRLDELDNAVLLVAGKFVSLLESHAQFAGRTFDNRLSHRFRAAKK
jgi:hypothetical protein